MTDFTVYLTSLGSGTYFPDNDNGYFSNALYRPLTGMQNYKVGLIGCYISSPSPPDTILVCLNIVPPNCFNEKQLPVVGVYPSSNSRPTYVNVIADTISIISCSLFDVSGKKVSLNSVPLIVLHFKKIK